MKAIQCTAYGPPENLTLETLDDPTPGKGQVLVDVKAAGAGFVDGLVVQGLYQVKTPTPFIPGSETAGIVTAVGEGVDNVTAGERVMAMALTGAFAEKTLLPSAALVRIPDNMDFPQAAGFIISYSTALYGFENCAALQPGETVLVLGAAGGVGLAAIDVAKAMGAHVVAGASTQAKRDACLKMGADQTIDYTAENWRDTLKEMMGGQGINLVFDPVGGPYSDPAFRCLAPGGRHMVIGFAAGEIARIPLNLPLLKRSSIVGVDWGGWARSNPLNNVPILEKLVAWVEDGVLNPAAEAIYPLAETGQALRDMLDRKAVGKVVITP